MKTKNGLKILFIAAAVAALNLAGINDQARADLEVPPSRPILNLGVPDYALDWSLTALPTGTVAFFRKDFNFPGDGAGIDFAAGTFSFVGGHCYGHQAKIEADQNYKDRFTQCRLDHALYHTGENSDRVDRACRDEVTGDITRRQRKEDTIDCTRVAVRDIQLTLNADQGNTNTLKQGSHALLINGKSGGSDLYFDGGLAVHIQAADQLTIGELIPYLQVVGIDLSFPQANDVTIDGWKRRDAQANLNGESHADTVAEELPGSYVLFNPSSTRIGCKEAATGPEGHAYNVQVGFFDQQVMVCWLVLDGADLNWSKEWGWTNALVMPMGCKYGASKTNNLGQSFYVLKSRVGEFLWNFTATETQAVKDKKMIVLDLPTMFSVWSSTKNTGPYHQVQSAPAGDPVSSTNNAFFLFHESQVSFDQFNQMDGVALDEGECFDNDNLFSAFSANWVQDNRDVFYMDRSPISSALPQNGFSVGSPHLP